MLRGGIDAVVKHLVRVAHTFVCCMDEEEFPLRQLAVQSHFFQVHNI